MLRQQQDAEAAEKHAKQLEEAKKIVLNEDMSLPKAKQVWSWLAFCLVCALSGHSTFQLCFN